MHECIKPYVIWMLAGLLVTAAVLWLLPGSSSIGAGLITIDPGRRYQTITGFGAMLYPYAEPYPMDRVPDVFARDLGCSIARIEIIPQSMEEEPKDLEVFLSEPIDSTIARLNFNERAIKIVGEVLGPIESKKLDHFKLIATVWSPPKWMKTNNSVNNGGRVRADRREHFAKFLAAYCKGFERTYDVKIDAVSIQNEPKFEQFYHSCTYDPEKSEYYDTVLAVVAAFKKHVIGAKLFGPENMVGDARGGWFYDQNMKYIGQVVRDQEVANYFQSWAFHGYAADGKTSASSSRAWLDYYTDLKDTKKELWLTETSGSSPEWIHHDAEGRPNGAIVIGQIIHDALVFGNVNAWVYWSFQDGDQVTDSNLTAKGDKTSKKYCVAKHYFRYIRPGAVRVGAMPDSPLLNVSAFLHELQKTLTVVLVNSSDEDRPVELELPEGLGIGSFKAFRTSGHESFVALEDQRIEKNRARFQMPSKSIVTLWGQASGNSF